MQKKLLVVIVSVSLVLIASVALVLFASGSQHVHTFDEEWTYDDANHWHEATCGHTSEVSGKAKHNFCSGTIITSAACETDGMKTLKCECGATKSEPIASMGHAYEWETQSEATCVSAEILKGTCSVCGAVTTKEGDMSNEHLWGKYEIITAPTTSVEGKMKAKCKNCGEATTLKVLMTPQLTLDNVKLTWRAVNNAQGYKLYDNDKLVADLGNVLSYEISLEETTHNYVIEAYTKDVDYYSASFKSNVAQVAVSLGENLQAKIGTDFEGFKEEESIEIVKTWVKDYYNNSAGKFLIINGKDNTYAKLLPTADGGSAIITKSCNTAVLKAGTYQLSLDVKLGSKADGTLSFGVWDGKTWTPQWPKAAIDITGANADTWTTVTYEYTLSQDKAGTYANLDLAYTCVSAGEDNYILVDNIRFINTAANRNVDTGKHGDFEGFFTPLVDLLKTNGWKADSTGNVVYVSEKALENEIIVEDDGNKCFKFYTSTKPSTSVDFAGNTAFAKAGIYKMSVKVKLGAGATNVNNIGFRFYAEKSLNIGDITFRGLEKLNSSEWVTLEAYFIVPETVDTKYINMNFWVFTHNDEIGRYDNYVLMDDIEVRAVYLSADKEGNMPCEHSWGEWYITKEATCTSVGEEERVCSKDKTHKETREIPLKQHEYDKYEIITAPTSSTEGKMEAKCKNPQCREALTLKVLMTPQLTLDNVELTWSAVDNAKGYKLYDNGILVADLGDVLSYEIPSKETTHSYAIEAYTDAVGYHSVSLKSNVVQVTVSLGENLQASKGTDFEGFSEEESIEIVKTWVKDYYNNSAGKFLIINGKDNTYAKLLPATDAGSAIMTKSCNTAVLKAGTYQLSFDVKLASKADGTLSFGIWDGNAWAPQWPKVTIDVTGASADTWTTITHEFTLSQDKTGTYANLDLAYTCVAADEDNYVLVDNIRFINTTTNSNVDTGKHGDFEGIFTPLSDLLKTSGWKADSTGDVIYVSATDLENEIAVEDNGNKCFKFYTSTKSSTSINFAGNTAFAKAGIYKMSVKVKLGADATNVNNIGFRFYAANSLNTGDITFDGLEKLNSSEWVTLEAYFIVPETVSTNYINMNFWVFTHNDAIGSADNYVLMDDIEVRAVKLTVQ